MTEPNRLEKELKPDWKEWIPIYGLKQVRDDLYNKSFDPGKQPTKFRALALYHGITGFLTIFGAIYGIHYTSELIKKILE
ncbi:hypothetical protein HYX15_01715 [Candidatus Woesearchaeota archaeon]|nr:hypothetical protein [Candidatus Woesearchaeota archaeon]